MSGEMGVEITSASGESDSDRLATVATPSSVEGEKGSRFASRRPTWKAAAALTAVVAITLVAQGFWRAKIGDVVEKPLAAADYTRARVAIDEWMAAHGDSAEVEFYRAWLAFAQNDVPAATDALDRCEKLGLDRKRIQLLSAIFASRSGSYAFAEPILREAYAENAEPRGLVARELARLLIETFRLPDASEPLERWKSLDPKDARPYLWTNEILLRSDAVPQILIRNYQAALERDPNLDKARLGLAEQLTKDRQFEEAERVFQEYLARKPGDAVALVGLGRNAFQAGDLENAVRQFEAALKANPKNADALRDLALADIRAGKPKQACARYKMLVELEPFDLEIRYAYAQALRLSGEDVHAREQSELAAKLRVDAQRITQIHKELVAKPNDVAIRFAAAQWMLDHGHDAEGIKWTKDVLRADPKHVPTHRLLASYYEKHGDAGLANYHRLMAGVDGSSKGTSGNGTP